MRPCIECLLPILKYRSALDSVGNSSSHSPGEIPCPWRRRIKLMLWNNVLLMARFARFLFELNSIGSDGLEDRIAFEISSFGSELDSVQD